MEQNPNSKPPPFWLQPLIPLVKNWDRPKDAFTRPSLDGHQPTTTLQPAAALGNPPVQHERANQPIRLIDRRLHFDHPVTMLVSHLTELFLTHYQPQIQVVWVVDSHKILTMLVQIHYTLRKGSLLHRGESLHSHRSRANGSTPDLLGCC